MSQPAAAPNRSASRELVRLRTALLVPAAVYPLWHLAAPAGATDPWLAWWAISACFFGVALASRWSGFVQRHLLGCIHVCSALVTLQLYLLAHLNDMHPFYAIGSVMAVLSTVFFIRTRSNLLAYGVFIGLLGALLFALEPDGRKLAWWGALLTVAAGWYQRLGLQEKRVEAERAYQHDLERSVAERTRELALANRRLQREMEQRERLEEELRFSQKMEALGQLAGGVAHDFNNLLTTIELYADLLAQALGPGSPQLDEVTRIQRAGRQAAELTQQLLAFSRRSEIHAEVLDLNEVVAESASMLRHLLGEDVELCCLPGPEPQCVRSNAGELQQVLVNLALNARDAMPAGGRFTLELGALRRNELRARGLPEALGAETYVLLAASDTGVGMDAETRARVFDPFFTRKEVRKGTGLGLSIVYGIVSRAGGHVRVQSEPGKGARFELYWPRSQEAPARADAPAAGARLRGGPESILVVEDDPDLRAALARTLRSSGYRVVEAEHAEAALAVAAQADARVDLVLSDVVMPKMSGLELVERLAELRPAWRVLLISGQLNHPSLRDRALPAGVELLQKPFEAAELASRLRELLAEPPRTAS